MTSPPRPAIMLALYVVGCFGVTAARNVPMNDALEAASPGGPAEAELWRRYLARWTAWNHVRTAACLAAAAAFTWAPRVGGAAPGRDAR